MISSVGRSDRSDGGGGGREIECVSRSDGGGGDILGVAAG